MDTNLYQASLNGDVPALIELTRVNKHILNQRSTQSLNTPLHHASRRGHLKFVLELIKLLPELITSKNANLETPLHNACREGHVEVCKALLDADPNVAYLLDCEKQSALSVACRRGHLRVVRLLLDALPLLLASESEEDGSSTSLHMAALSGQLEITKEILKVRLDSVWKRDRQGRYPIHLATMKNHLDIIHEFLTIDAELCNTVDGTGMTPLHIAAINGHVDILHEILSTCHQSVWVLTKQGESFLHLAVKNNRYDAVRSLMEEFDVAELINLPNKKGNTILHVATMKKYTTMVEYLTDNPKVNVNAVNGSRSTALDIITTDSSDDSRARQLIDILENAGAKRAKIAKRANLQPCSLSEMQNKVDKRSSARLSSESRDLLVDEKQLEFHNEALRNARNTVIIVGVLIATVAFSAGITPPGGIYQNDPNIGKAVAASWTAFKVYKVSNDIALFMSLGIVTILVSIIPFQRRSLMMLLMMTHKAMLVAVTFMAIAYVAATWVILPQKKKMTWLLVIVTMGGGGFGLLLLGLGLMQVMPSPTKSSGVEDPQSRSSLLVQNQENRSWLKEHPEITQKSRSRLEEQPHINSSNSLVAQDQDQESISLTARHQKSRSWSGEQLQIKSSTSPMGRGQERRSRLGNQPLVEDNKSSSSSMAFKRLKSLGHSRSSGDFPDMDGKLSVVLTR